MSESLKMETVLNLCTLQQVWPLLGRSEAKSPDDSLIRQRIAELSYEAMLIMNRGIVRKSRTETLDIKPYQRSFYVSSPPIDAVVGITARINLDEPRVWTKPEDLIDAEDIFIGGDRAARGEVYIEGEFGNLIEALQIVYTGGLGTITGAWGWDGASANTGAGGIGVFTSAVGSFVTDGVVAGCKLKILNGLNSPTTWTVLSVQSETQLTVTAAFTSGSTTDQRFYVLDSNGTSIIHDWPLIASAIAGQTANDWTMRARQGIVSENVGGVGVTWVPPGGWLNRNLRLLERHRVRRF